MHNSSEFIQDAKQTNMKHLSYGLLAPGLLRSRYAKSVVEDKPNSESDYYESNVALGFGDKEDESLLKR